MDEENNGRHKMANIPCSKQKDSPGHVRPPNRTRHEQQIAQIQSYINLREDERKQFSQEARAERERLTLVRGERERIQKEKIGEFAELEKINKDVSKKSESVQKLRSGLSYPSAELLEQQIHRLEVQINKGHFKLAEERRLVAEIDRLRRNKRSLGVFCKEKGELEELRGRQKTAREAREDWFRSSKDARAKEEEGKARLRSVVQKLDQTKKSQEELNEEKRILVTDFRNHENEWRKQMEKKKEEIRRKAEDEKRRMGEENLKEEDEIRASSEPFLTERTLVSLLLHYCEKLAGQSTPATPPIHASVGGFLAVPGTNRRRSSGYSMSSSASSHYGTPLGQTPISGTPPVIGSPPATDTGVYSRKNSALDSEIFFPGNGKKGKRDKRRRSSTAMRRVLAHSPDTYTQFERLGLSPPLTLATVGEVQERLREKLDEFEHKAAAVKLSRLSMSQVEANLNTEEEGSLSSKSRGKLTLPLTPLAVPIISIHAPGIPTDLLESKLNPIEVPVIEEKQLVDHDTKGINENCESGAENLSIISGDASSDSLLNTQTEQLVQSALSNNENALNDALGKGPIIKVTDCDIGKTEPNSSNNNGIIANNCIIAR